MRPLRIIALMRMAPGEQHWWLIAEIHKYTSSKHDFTINSALHIPSRVSPVTA